MPICKYKPCSKPFEYKIQIRGNGGERLNTGQEYCCIKCKQAQSKEKTRLKRATEKTKKYEQHPPANKEWSVENENVSRLLTMRW